MSFESESLNLGLSEILIKNKDQISIQKEEMK